VPLALGCGHGELAKQGGHRPAFVDEDPQPALGRRQGQRLGEGGQPALLIAGGVQGECLQRSELDDAGRALLRGGQVVQAP